MSSERSGFDGSQAAAIVNQRGGFLTEQSQASAAHGESSTAFFFEVGSNRKVLRLSETDAGFIKDRLVAEYFASGSVPVPAVDEVVRRDEGGFYAVSERVAGRPLYDLPTAELAGMFPAYIDTLNAIHNTVVPGEGYGAWYVNGNGSAPTWRDALEAMQHQEDDEHVLARIPLDLEQINDIRQQIHSLYRYCPEDRALLHGDYNFNNVLGKNGIITGVIDWQASQYGDPLYDYAWLRFWSTWQNPQFSAYLDRYLHESSAEYANFDERLRCYELIIGIESLCHYAGGNNVRKLTYVYDTLQSIA